MPLKRLYFLLLITGALASLGAWAASSLTSEEKGPRLTHIVTRGDLVVSVTEQGLLESAENTEVKSKIRGRNAVLWIIESGSIVEKGDELVRLDSLFIEEQIDERTKYAHWSRSSAERSAANVARAELAVKEYQEGRYVSQLLEHEKALAIAQSNLRAAKDRVGHTRLMVKSEYESDLELEAQEFRVDQARLRVDLLQTQLDVFKDFTHKEELQTLQGEFKAAAANHKANAERAGADASRRDRAVEEYKYCVLKAPRAGLVIHPNAASWEAGPIEEGTRVWKDQVLLLMPDLSQMQVKVGVHEAVVDQVKKGMPARVTVSLGDLDGSVSSISSVTRPAGWWTANEVRYDTLVAVPETAGLKPGMSAEVEIVIAEHKDVLTIPVAALVEENDSTHCWVKTDAGLKKRTLELGDTNDIHTIVKSGLKEGDEVILNPPRPVVEEKDTTDKATEEKPTGKK